jgi:hypothetical protein
MVCDGGVGTCRHDPCRHDPCGQVACLNEDGYCSTTCQDTDHDPDASTGRPPMTRHRRHPTPTSPWPPEHWHWPKDVPPPPRPPRRPPRPQMTRRITPTYGPPREPWPELPGWLLTAVWVLLILLVAATWVLGL